MKGYKATCDAYGRTVRPPILEAILYYAEQAGRLASENVAARLADKRILTLRFVPLSEPDKVLSLHDVRDGA